MIPFEIFLVRPGNCSLVRELQYLHRDGITLQNYGVSWLRLTWCVAKVSFQEQLMAYPVALEDVIPN